MRVLFFGTAAFAVPSLERLVAHRSTVVLCVTQPDRPRGRGLIAGPSPVKQAALRLRLPLSQPEHPRAELFQALHPDIGVAIAYGELLTPEVLGVSSHGMFGVHPSLLPAYRGAAPIAWALLNGETTTGVTVFRMNEWMDAGEIVTQRRVEILPGENAEALTGRLADLGAEELMRALEAVEAGQARLTPQDPAQATLASKLTKAHGRIDWRRPAEAIDRQVRALIPWPGAVSTWRGQALKILKASVGTEHRGQGVEPGTVVHVAAEALVVATGHGVLRIEVVQLAGRRRMSVQEFLAGHPMRVGNKFETGDRRQGTGETA